jgi:hypothetical protein
MTLDLEKLRALAENSLPMPVDTAQIAHETYCPRAGGPVTLYDGTCPACGWHYNPYSYSTVYIDARDLLALVEEVECFRADASEMVGLRSRAEKAEANYAFMVERAANQHLDGYRELGARAATAENEADRLRGEAKVANALHQELNDLFGWGDESMLHASLHVRNAVLNLRADLAAARSEAKRVTEKHERLQERLSEIEKANVDRWNEGYAAAQRQIAAWLRVEGPVNHLWAAETIEHGYYREEEP